MVEKIKITTRRCKSMVMIFLVIVILIGAKGIWVSWAISGHGSFEKEKKEIVRRANYLTLKVATSPQQLLDEMPSGIGTQFQGEWVAKIRRNKERDKDEQKKLANMGWHCITVWECELKPAKREETLDSIAFTLNHIWLQDHGAKTIPYPKLDEEDIQMPLAAEDRV